MVDYSKWDNLVVSSDEESDQGGGGLRPQVERFDSPQSVTFGGQQQQSENGGPTIQPTTTVVQRAAGKADASTSCDVKVGDSSTPSPPHIDPWTRNGGRPTHGRYVWSQTADVLQVTFKAPPGCKAKQVHVDLEQKFLRVRLTDCAEPMVLGEGDLYMAVDAGPDAVAGCWRLEDDAASVFASTTPAGRLLIVDLTKSVPEALAGARVWWNRVYADESEQVDTHALPDRPPPGAGAKAFQKSWDEAHDMFKQRVKKIVPTEISLPPEEGE